MLHRDFNTHLSFRSDFIAVVMKILRIKSTEKFSMIDFFALPFSLEKCELKYGFKKDLLQSKMRRKQKMDEEDCDGRRSKKIIGFIQLTGLEYCSYL